MNALLVFVLIGVNVINVVLVVQCWQIISENDDLIAEIGESLDRICAPQKEEQ